MKVPSLTGVVNRRDAHAPPNLAENQPPWMLNAPVRGISNNESSQGRPREARAKRLVVRFAAKLIGIIMISVLWTLK
jgi:hypothetical protein